MQTLFEGNSKEALIEKAERREPLNTCLWSFVQLFHQLSINPGEKPKGTKEDLTVLKTNLTKWPDYQRINRGISKDLQGRKIERMNGPVSINLMSWWHALAHSKTAEVPWETLRCSLWSTSLDGPHSWRSRSGRWQGCMCLQWQLLIFSPPWLPELQTVLCSSTYDINVMCSCSSSLIAYT